MEANTRKLERIFDQTICYQVPLFQRPYVWTKERNWEPLWEDILTILETHLSGRKPHPHFLGAVVLEQLANPTGSIESRQVIDGQQRFTTLQLFLLAARDHATAHQSIKYAERFTDLVANRRSKIDNDDEVFKVWPTNSNRDAFRAVHEAGSPSAVDRKVVAEPGLADGTSNIIEGYKYFHECLGRWLACELNDENASFDDKTIDDRFEAVWLAIKDSLQVVVIDLGEEDETQIIFETLNARGEDLLPADLIKNYLFRRVTNDGEEVEKLYVKNWKAFESDWWRENVTQGRSSRARIDVFINHYLTLMTREEVKSSNIFNAFKSFAEQGLTVSSEALLAPTTAAQHIAQLARYADVFKKFYDSSNSARLSTFLRRLDAVDTTTVFPFLLHIYAALIPGRTDEFNAILDIVESYLMRRMICRLTTKNYNRFFVDLIRALDKKGVISATTVAEQLAKGTGDSTIFPDDSMLESAVLESPLYGRLAQYKIHAVFEALDAFALSKKSEIISFHEKLTIEHVMPRAWKSNWPLEALADADPAAEIRSTARRNLLINTLGNLTLITGSLNPALSNSAWEAKRPELLKFSKLNLTQYFHRSDADTWDESAIQARGRHLLQNLIQIWPYLDASDISEILPTKVSRSVAESPSTDDQGNSSIDFPSFSVSIEASYWNDGFFNTGVSVSALFGEDKQAIDIFCGNDDDPIVGMINRSSNENGSPRIFGRRALRDWFQREIEVGQNVVIHVHSSTSIRVATTSIPPVENGE